MIPNRSNNLTFRYGLYQFTFYLSCAGIFGFATTYLLEKGFQTAEVGIIIAVSYLLSCVVQPFLGDFADRFPRIRLQYLIAACLLCCFLCFMGIQLFHPPLAVFGVLYAAGGLAITITVPLSNALCVYYNERDYRMDYGIGFGVGSFSYSVATLGLGYLIAMMGNDWMIWIILGSLLLQLTITLGYPRLTERNLSIDDSGQHQECANRVSIWIFFAKYKYFMITIAGVMMIAMCHSMAENYLINLFTPMGGNSRNVGVSLSVASFSAAPFLLMFEKVQKKINIIWLMRLSGIFYVGRTMIMFFASSIWQVYASSCLQTVTYGFIYPSLFYFTKMKIEKADMAKGQAVVVAAFTLGTALGSFVGGKTIDAFGYQTMILTAGVLAAMGAVVINCSNRK